MRLLSSGIPAHAYGEANKSWAELVVDQQWNFTIPLVSEDGNGGAIDEALERDVDPTEFLVAAAQADRPLGMALNGVPFFSPLTDRGARRP